MLIFKCEFATFLDDKLIIDGLVKLAHKLNKNPQIFFPRLEKLFHVLNKNYTSYRIKLDCPVQQAQGSYLEDALTKYGNDSVRFFSEFLLAQVFWVAAPKTCDTHLSQGSKPIDSGQHISDFLHRAQGQNAQKDLHGPHNLQWVRATNSRPRNWGFPTTTKQPP
jgi:hypothetical protein